MKTAELSDTATDWRRQIPEHRRRHLRIWFLSGAALTVLILVIGGITRLTQSGLSIVDWQPIMGVVPPLNEAQWQEAFDRYRQFPEYQQLRQGMTLGEFKFIFFWEYIHRIAARLVGMVFLIPFLAFWARGYFNRPLLRWSLALFALGAMQGFMGWIMVASGLVDRPSVSHYRLAAHLSLALLIFGCCVWLAREMSVRPAGAARPASDSEAGRRGLRGVYVLGGLLFVQILWGAFVAGLKAGRIFNTFPLMGDGLVPPGAWELRPWLLNLFANPATVQWAHRVLGTVLLIAAVVVLARRLRPGWDATVRRMSAAFLALVVVQYALGVLTLLYRVPVSLGVLHQAFAVVILAVWVAWLHHAIYARRSEPSAAPPPVRVAP
jgi:heme a synthase